MKLNKKSIITDNIQIVAYADDITIVAISRQKLIKAIEKIEEEAKQYEMEINQSKTKYMKVGREERDTQKYLKTQRHNYETVTNFNYLGTTIQQSGKDRIKKRILKGNQAYGRNMNLLKSKAITK